MDRNAASRAVRGVRLSRMIALLVATGAIWSASIAAGRCDAVADFYRGRSISLVIGFGAGGGYDAYARLLARHIGRHIPGNPSLVAQNMQGAGGLKATQFLYDVAPRDGTVIGTVARGQPLAPLLLGNTSFDATRFTWVGSVTDEASLCLSWFTSKARTWRDLMTAETLFAGEGQGADPDMFATALNRVFGAKIKLITGFHSTREMTLAMQRGEVEGICGVSATTLLGQYADWIAGKKVNLLAQMALRKDDRFPDVPLVTELSRAKSSGGSSGWSSPVRRSPVRSSARRASPRIASRRCARRSIRRCRTPSSGPRLSARRWTSIRCRELKWRASCGSFMRCPRMWSTRPPWRSASRTGPSV